VLGWDQGGCWKGLRQAWDWSLRLSMAAGKATRELPSDSGNARMTNLVAKQAVTVEKLDTSHLSVNKREILEAFLRGELFTPPTGRPRIDPRPVNQPAPLSFQQLQVWLHAQSAPEIPYYNETLTVFRHGPVNLPILEHCIQEIVRRHEILRTTFSLQNGEPVQIIYPAPAAYSIPRIDLRNTPEPEKDSIARRMAAESAQRLFDLNYGPLFRTLLVRLGDDESRLYMTFHHIIFDGVSAYQVLLPELATLYDSFSAGELSPLPQPALQYADFAYWQRKSLSPNDWAADQAYWQEQLSGELPVLEFPTDRPRAVIESHRGEAEWIKFSKSLVQPLRAIAREQGTSLYAPLLASFAALIHRRTSMDELLIGGMSSGRDLSELESMPGFFVNPLALRIDLSGHPTFRELVSRVGKRVLEALERQHVPFAEVLKEIHHHAYPGQHPVYQVIFSQQPSRSGSIEGWDLILGEIPNGGSKLDLHITLDERDDEVFGSFVYNSDLYDRSTIQRLMHQWKILLEGIAKSPDQPLSELAILNESDRTRILYEWNDTRTDYPRDFCLHQLIEAQADRTLEAVALRFEGTEILYRELNARANQLAHYLRKLGVRPDGLVGVCMERSFEMIVALLGILKAGGAYVPLDAGYPKDRLAFMVEDSGLKVLVTDQASDGNWDNFPVKLVCIDRDWSAISREPAKNPVNVGKPEDIAYVIYTSGSAGKPKGVQIPHRAVVNFVNSIKATPGITEHDAVLALTTISFDIAGLELYVPLTVGARIVLASRQMATDPGEIARCVEREHVTFMQATPVTWGLLIESGWRGKSDLKILCGGEALSRDLADKLLSRGASVWNMYGPTETTIWSTLDRIRPGSYPILIGRPIANTETYILDTELQPVPVGTTGDLYIGGDGLARGYLNRPELTVQQFVPHPFNAGSRIYKTGDLARFHADGRIECLGRADRQVKIRGHRIELGEIESSLRRHENVREAVVIVREDTPSDRRLVGYVVLGAEQASLELIRDFLKQKLPLYMIPELIKIDHLPLTPNGKLDRKSLPVSNDEEPERAGFEEPQDEIEKLLAQYWTEALKVDRVSIYDNFFDLGGHSLSAIKFVARLQAHLGVRIRPSEVAFQTLGQLAAVCRERARCP
jgi:amino acid adenylation domain-containing protein